MVVDDFHVLGSIVPAKADAELVVDPDGMLPDPVSALLFLKLRLCVLPDDFQAAVSRVRMLRQRDYDGHRVFAF
jgi:hypothetical protein